MRNVGKRLPVRECEFGGDGRDALSKARLSLAGRVDDAPLHHRLAAEVESAHDPREPIEDNEALSGAGWAGAYCSLPLLEKTRYYPPRAIERIVFADVAARLHEALHTRRLFANAVESLNLGVKLVVIDSHSRTRPKMCASNCCTAPCPI